jgi:DegV family protein with EDD domain
MEKIRIITDAASDISKADELRYGIRVIPFAITIGDKSYMSRVELSNNEFYDLMESCDTLPVTSQVSPFDFEELYLEEARAGYTELILVLINSKGSATYDNSIIAKNTFFAEHPEYVGKVNIRSFDSCGYSAIYGAPVIEAAKLLEQGESADSIAAYLSEALKRRQIYFGIYGLKYAARSGRIPTAAAFIGDKLNLKPVMKIRENAITTAAKCRGENRLIRRVAELAITDMKPDAPYQIIYGSDETCRDELSRIMTESLGYPPQDSYQIGAVIAANCGPKIVGVAFDVK